MLFQFSLSSRQLFKEFEYEENFNFHYQNIVLSQHHTTHTLTQTHSISPAAPTSIFAKQVKNECIMASGVGHRQSKKC